VLVLLVAGETGSFSQAGLVSGAYLLATGAFGPGRGRLVDRLAPSRVLVGLAVVHGVALLMLLGLVLADAVRARSSRPRRWPASRRRRSVRRCACCGMACSAPTARPVRRDGGGHARTLSVWPGVRLPARASAR
jgi:MFS family permease